MPSETARKKKKCNRPCNARFNNISACNALIKKDLTVKGTTNLNGQVNNNVGGTYTIYSPTDPNYSKSDFPTIQAGIDFVSSGLKPNSNVTLQVMPGVYDEALYIDTSLSDPSYDEPESDVHNVPSRGLRILGDQRPIAAMCYMNGGFVESDPSFYNNPPQGYLGTLNAQVTLTNSGNTLTVTQAPIPGSTTPVTQADFVACGVTGPVGATPGDVIFFSYPDGAQAQRNVTSVYGNTVTYDSTPLFTGTIGNGACLIFEPNVQIAPSGIDSNPSPLFILDGVVEMVGFYLNKIASGGYGMSVPQNGILMPGNILIFNGESGPSEGGQILLTRGDGDIAGHMTLIESPLFVNDGSYIANGDWYIVRSGGRGAFIGYKSAIHINSMQINGGGGANPGLSSDGQGADISIDTVFVAYNCKSGLGLTADSVFTGRGSILIDAGTVSSATGIQASDAAQLINTGPSATGFTSSISNVETAISENLNSEFSFAGPLTITNADTGITLTNGSSFIAAVPVSFNGTTTDFAYSVNSVIQNGQASSFAALALPGPYPSDAAAFAAGVPLYGLYLSGTNPSYVVAQTTVS